ncbi:hypothetical protein [Pyrobaculum neutrophilum]|uniref:FUN14 family protein n=1 Tax=Pyrobaculum neutrophilum (strain DSM 2338 / JCM 9278 / NBRC 100436 / V24Sta) TaxID=444157 RepID=B1YAB1_PYRNV|nr:hypothetical protein [Pyrobaculum neutrophilum]ACB39085.1 conserved hypothetical protein [Pyrobaculum neutrophilum V24Sta]
MLGEVLALLGPFIVGFLVGVLAKRLLSAAVALLALFVALAALGYISPQQVTAILQQLGYAAKDAVYYATKVKDAVPYSSLAFLLGLALGLWKG